MDKIVNIRGGNISFSHSISKTAASSLEISHCHNDYEILFVTDGKGKYIIEGSEFSVTPGVLMCARPLEYHCIKIDKGKSYERFVINFDKSEVLPEAEAVFESIISGSQQACVYSSLGFSESVMSVFSRFLMAEAFSEERRVPYMRLLLSELIMMLSVSEEKMMSSGDGALGARVIKYLNENIDQSITLEKIAKNFFVSKYYLCRTFKKYNGISVHGYINRKRVLLAKQLIESGETASRAAYRVGFCDYSAFYRAYTKVLGEAPTARGRALDKNEEVSDAEV